MTVMNLTERSVNAQDFAALLAASGTVRIFEIQGTAHRSPLEGEFVTDVPGIVTSVANNGFYMQDVEGDGDDATSDALFVFTATAPDVTVGDAVLVSGQVSEFRPGGAASGNLTTTQMTATASDAITIFSSDNPLPEPVTIGRGGRIPPTGIISPPAIGADIEDPANPFNPDEFGIDFFESLEGMRVQVNDAVVIAPTNQFNEVWVLADDGADATRQNPRGGVTIGPDNFNPERIQIQFSSDNVPQVNVGDRLGTVSGVIGYSFGNFEILDPSPVTVTPGGLEREVTPLTTEGDFLTVASYNVENLSPFSPVEQFTGLGKHIAINLGGPDVIGLQEIQDNTGPDPIDPDNRELGSVSGVVRADESYQLLIDAIVAAGGPTYKFQEVPPVDGQDGGQPGGNIRVGYLYNPDRVNFVVRPGATPTSDTAVVNGRLSESPGRIDPNNPAFVESRKPLAGEFVFNGQRLVLVNNHFSAKTGSDPLFGRFQPPTNAREDIRAEQALVNRRLVEQLLESNPSARAIVLGDINEFEFFPPLEVLTGRSEGNQILFNLTETLPELERHSYIFQGNSQSLDHILVTESLLEIAEYDPVRVNSEFFDQISDHDPVLARFNLPNPTASDRPILVGTAGNDEIAAGSGQIIIAGAGDDLVAPAPNSTGGNRIFGIRGNNELFARQNDRLFGGPGNDYLNAADGLGGNKLYGVGGNNFLIAGVNDELYGGNDDDILYAGRGNNVLTGGRGNDQFWIAFDQLPESVNTITDFGLGNNVIGIRNIPGFSSFEDLTLVQSGSNTLIQAGDRDLALLVGVEASTLTSNQFVFA